MSGPLAGVKVIEIAGIGPGPFCAMMLADLGAEVVRVDRAGSVNPALFGQRNLDLLNRGRRSVGVDLKSAEGVEVVLRLAEQADALIEGFRPGVAERLGVGPDVCLGRNPALVYGRMTGWGQDGPMAHAAGHDVNYISLAGAQAHIGRAGEPPTPPLNLVGDFGGGGLLLAYGIVCGILSASRTGRGQVVDAAMVDGAAALMTMMWGFRAMGIWSDDRGTNLLDSGAPWYDVYECADGGFVSIGAIEPQFYAELIERIGLAGEDLPHQMDRSGWPELRRRFREVFAGRTRAEWSEVLEGSDACFAPVLSMAEAAEHPHMKARETFVESGGVVQPAPAPRFSSTPASIRRPPPWPGEHTDEVLAEWSFGPDEVAALRTAGAVA